jgi:GTP-binding protein
LQDQHLQSPEPNNPVDFHQARYLISASTLQQCPPDDALEVAFVGRSNAGKSSAINVLTGQTKLARTSKTPGRTQLLNYFEVAESRYLVDLPGFGYAKVPAPMKNKWQKELENYLRNRKSLQGLVLLMDIRHPFKDFDEIIVEWCRQSDMPLHVLLTKADKLKFGAAKSTLLQAEKHLAQTSRHMSVQLFSALKGDGVDILQARLQQWLNPDDDKQAADPG